MASVVSGTQRTQYFYDADGTLVKKVDARGTTAYVGADDEVLWLVPTQTVTVTVPATFTHKLYFPLVALALNAATGVSTTYYRFNGARVAMRQGSSVYWLHGDQLGSASLVTSITGTVVSELRYKPYGETRYSSGDTPTDRLFTGQRQDGSLYDFGARFFDPQIGRFISVDTLIQSPDDPQLHNRYSYGRNNPLLYNDPSGHCIGIALGIDTLICVGVAELIVSAAIAAVGVATYYYADPHSAAAAQDAVESLATDLTNLTPLPQNTAHGDSPVIEAPTSSFPLGPVPGQTVETSPLGEEPGSVILSTPLAGDSTLQLIGPVSAKRKKVSEDVTARPGSFRKPTRDSALENAPTNEQGQRICPTCGQILTNPDIDHYPKTWAERIPGLRNVTRKQVLDEYNRDVRAQCPTCNRSHRYEGKPGKYEAN